MPLSPQLAIDYRNDAQKRVGADTLALALKATIALTEGTATYALPADLVEFDGIYDGSTRLDALSATELLGALSGAVFVGPRSYAIVGTTLYVLPTPTAAGELTLMYRARPPDVTSDAGVSLAGEAADLAARLAEASQLLDGGQPELAVNELARYEQDARRLRRQNRAKAGLPGSISVGR